MSMSSSEEFPCVESGTDTESGPMDRRIPRDPMGRRITDLKCDDAFRIVVPHQVVGTSCEKREVLSEKW